MAISVFKSAVTSIPLFDLKVCEGSSFQGIGFFDFRVPQKTHSRENVFVTFGNLAIDWCDIRQSCYRLRKVALPDVCEKKFNVCMCVCPVYMCVCLPLSMWMTLSFRDFAPYLLIGWLCRIVIADFAPYLLLGSHNLLFIVKADTSILPLPFFVLIRINQTRAFFFHHKLRFADTSFPLLLIIQKSRHELSSSEIIWDLNCSMFFFFF